MLNTNSLNPTTRTKDLDPGDMRHTQFSVKYHSLKSPAAAEGDTGGEG